VKGPGNVVPIHVSPPEMRRGTQSATELITVTATGARYGDPVTNAQVEKAAVDLVTTTYRDGAGKSTTCQHARSDGISPPVGQATSCTSR
jgi:hypothetical protein